MALTKVGSVAELESLSGNGQLPTVVHLWASWAPMCTQTQQLAERLAKECTRVKFASVDAEEAEDVVEKFDISSVPAFVFLQAFSGPIFCVV
jgi:thioredoxin-like negative regulator of GroEL